MSDAEIRTMVEQGRVPLCFAMADSDMIVTSAASGPKPVFVHALRSEFIPLLVLAGSQDMATINGASTTPATASSESKTGCILHKFALFAPASGSSVSSGLDSLLSDVWFDIAGVPIKWHLPVGVLYDYFVRAKGVSDQQNSAVMKITIHFQNFPKHIVIDSATGTGFGTILRWPTIDNERSMFFYSLKESHFIKHGDIGLINKLLPQQMMQLWGAVQVGDVTTFRVLNETLCPASSPSALLKNVPLRVFFDPAHPVAQFGLPAETATVADIIARMEATVSQTTVFANKTESAKWALYCNGLRFDDQPQMPLATIYKLFYSFDNYLYFAYLPTSETVDATASEERKPE